MFEGHFRVFRVFSMAWFQSKIWKRSSLNRVFQGLFQRYIICQTFQNFFVDIPSFGVIFRVFRFFNDKISVDVFENLIIG